MYSAKIKPKVDTMFDNLRKEVSSIVMKSYTANEAVNQTTMLVSSELATRSKSILSDMLFELSDNLLETDFFADDIARQNKFYEINLRQEILSKYQFVPTTRVNYEEASRAVQVLKASGDALKSGNAMEVGAVLAAGLSLAIAPIPISALVVVSIGALVAHHHLAGPHKDKRALAQALDNYLVTAKQQFLNWFDEVEKYFNKRVEEIKQTM